VKHTSEVSNYTHSENFDNMLREHPNKYLSLQELAHLAYSQPDASRPSEKYNYTNTDYILLGMIIEKITNKTWQQVFGVGIKHWVGNF